MSEHLPVEGSSSWHERLALLSPSLAGRSARHLVGLALVALLAVLVLAGVAWWLFRAPPPPVELSLPMATSAPPVGTGGSSSGAAGGAVGATSSPTTATTAVVVVQAAGAVVHPGVYELPADARVADLLAVAGGPAEGADADRLALAALLVDGQRVYVPRVGEDVPPSVAPVGGSGGAGRGAGASGAAAGPAAPLDLNAADAEALDGLPGVGPATAAAIVTHRERNGPFRSVDDLLDVPGIGPAKLAALRDQVRV